MSQPSLPRAHDQLLTRWHDNQQAILLHWARRDYECWLTQEIVLAMRGITDPTIHGWYL